MTARSEAEAIDAVREADAAGEPVLVLAGGSNVVVADEGFPGTVVRVLSRGIEQRDEDEAAVLTAQAGEPWDPLVARCVEDGLAGVEALSGIPGSVGATPIQNVGAYGQEVSQTLRSVRVYDRREESVAELSAGECGFGYRTSRFKREPGRWLVLAVTYALPRGTQSMPIAYAELARELGVAAGESAPLAETRAAVLRIRSRKGMVIDPADPDSVSVGSFFTNPVLDRDEFARVSERALETLGPDSLPPRFDQPDGSVKTSAAWLVERAGFQRGYPGEGPVRLSTKHTLAITNRGGASAAQVLALAREIADGVRGAFGVELVPEPVIVGG